MKNYKKILAVVLSLVMLMCAMPMSSLAEAGGEKTVSSLPFVTVSDIHYYPEELMGKNEDGSNNAVWSQYCRLKSKMFNESEAILRTALETLGQRAEQNGIKYVLVPGDLTKDSELAAHEKLAEILEEYEAKYNLSFFVINGNHDVNTTDACTFQNGVKEPTAAITAAQFPEVYGNLGYDEADGRYAYPENGENVQGALSYYVDLDENYRLIVLDSCNYSFDEPVKQITGGQYSKELMNWVKELADDAKAKGKTPFVMTHHGLSAHMETEPSITFAFPIDNYMDVAETFASWGINYAFTGHLHTNDVSSVTNDDGETLYDFETASLTGYPNVYRENVLETKANGKTAMTTNAVDFDSVQKMSFDGVTYDNGTYKYKAFALCFGGGLNESGKPDATSFLMGVVKNYLGSILSSINESGSVLDYLKTLNLDLEKILTDFLSPYIGDGIKIGSYNVFSVDNLMWFIEDLCDQISDLYIKNPDNLYNLVEGLVSDLMNIEVSNYPCTEFIDTLGFGDETRKGNLGDAVLSTMAHWYAGNEDISNDKFLLDTIDGFENGDTLERVFNTLVDLLLHDLVEDGILAKIEIRVDKLLSDDYLQKKMGEGINYLLYHVLRGDFTYMNLVDIVFATGVLPWNSIYDTLDKLLISKYLTDSQLESVGIFVAYILKDFATDEVPVFKGDSDVTYTSEKLEVAANRKNYRLPTMVSVTMGENSETQANINWFSKSTLESTDIEIYKADSEPEFKGVATKNADFTIKTESKITERQFPGIDIGVTGFLWYKFDMSQHTVYLSNLEPDTTYYYRVGNEKYGWWSETGKITTADGSDNVTFFHMTDPQSQNTRQYDRAWKNVLETAFNTHSDAAFIMNTGDLVDHGNNNKLWQYMFDCGSESLMSTYLMPVSGNHEGFGTNATANNFVLPGMPQQDTTTGVYYSFDYNNVHIAVLNTEDLAEDESLSEKQIEWLKDDMAKSDAQWKFVSLHKAIYSNGSHYKDDDVCALREQLSKLMPELKIDMVFQGHDHVYMRTGSIVDNKKVDYEKTYLKKDGNIYRTQVQPVGTSYVIGGCAGVKTYIQNDASATDKYFPRAEKAMGLETPMFSAIRIEGGVLYFDAYTVTDEGATVVDRFAIQKDKTQGDVVEDYKEAEEEVNTEEATSFVKTFFSTLVKLFTIAFNIYKIYILRVELR